MPRAAEFLLIKISIMETGEESRGAKAVQLQPSTGRPICHQASKARFLTDQESVRFSWKFEGNWNVSLVPKPNTAKCAGKTKKKKLGEKRKLFFLWTINYPISIKQSEPEVKKEFITWVLRSKFRWKRFRKEKKKTVTVERPNTQSTYNMKYFVHNITLHFHVLTYQPTIHPLLWPSGMYFLCYSIPNFIRLTFTKVFDL